MARTQMLYTLVLVCTISAFKNSHAQIFIGNEIHPPSILWAPLPDPQDDTRILNGQFTRIRLSNARIVSDIAFDPGEMMVYWCDIMRGEINRILLNGQNQEQLLTTFKPRAMTLDSLNRKIYWVSPDDRTVKWANTDGTQTQTVGWEPTNEKPYTISLDPVNENLYWASRSPDLFARAALDGTNRTNTPSFSPSAMTIENCADNTARLFYTSDALGVINLDVGDNETFPTMKSLVGSNTLNKYGGKLFWQEGAYVYGYDIPSLTLTKLTRTVEMIDDNFYSFAATCFRIFGTYNNDAVAIQDCPENINITLDEGSTSSVVSWAEPKLNSFSSCPSIEFSGDISNGGNVSSGTYDLSYMARDTAGNTDGCHFTVTVSEFSAVTCTINDSLPAQLSATTAACEAGMTITFGDDNCTYTCPGGYDISDGTAITCGSNGMLSASLPTCTAVTCTIDDPLPAQLSATTAACEAGMTITFGDDNCMYTCPGGYDISDGTAITCGSNRMLSASLPTCTAVTCTIDNPLPAQLSATTVECEAGMTITFDDDNCTYTCPGGYDISDGTAITCGSNGMISAFPTCTAVTCTIDNPLPAQLSATTVECEAGMTVTFGDDNCTYTCPGGYDISDGTAITCGSNRMLSASLPTCTVRQTTPSSNPTMESSDMSDHDHGDGGQGSSDCDRDQTGAGTTLSSFPAILRILVTTLIFVIIFK